jgi:hypothetical protein
MLLSLVLSAAAAPPVPAWSWPAGEVQRFHIETEILTPKGMRYYAANNLDARAGAVKVRADAGCTNKPEGKTNWVVCELAYIEVSGQEWAPGEQEKLDKILKEWSADLSKAKVELEIAKDGRVRTFDLLGGKERSNSREGFIIENQRVLLQRTFAAFDLPLTADEKDWVRGWPQKSSSALLQLQTIGGTAGAFDMKHTYKEDRYGLQVIETVAKATLSTGAAVDAESGSRLVEVRLAGESWFDAARGMLMWRDFTIDGRLSVSAQGAGSGAEYYQVGALQWVQDYPAPGEIPLSVQATRAPRLDGSPPPLPEGVALVSFGDLGMQALYIAGHPDVAKPLRLPAVKVRARVFVGADGTPSKIKAFEGFAVLGLPTEEALAGARFPVRGGAYAVDVEVEWRPE